MEITKNKWLFTYNDEQFWLDIQTEFSKLKEKYPKLYNSPHEVYAVLAEELDEFWESVKKNNPDPEELMQLAVSSIAGVLWLSALGRSKLETKKNESKV